MHARRLALSFIVVGLLFNVASQTEVMLDKLVLGVSDGCDMRSGSGMPRKLQSQMFRRMCMSAKSSGAMVGHLAA